MPVPDEEGPLDLLLKIPSLEDHTRQEEQKCRIGQPIRQGESHISHAEVEMVNHMPLEVESFEVGKRIVNGIDGHLADFV
jgi:hypothetical protein